MSDALKIGSEIWTRDPRDHRKPWEHHTITGETRVSWLIEINKWSTRKFAKMTMLENHGPQWGTQRWYTDAEKADKEFVDTHRHHIQRLVSVEVDATKLKQIAEILGMELSCNPPS